MGDNRISMVVTSLDFERFLDTVVTPKFNGFTYFDIMGSYQGKRERAWLLSIVTEDSDANRAVLGDINMTFDEWWNSEDNPTRHMPSTTRDQIKWFMRLAWFAGRDNKSATKKEPK